MAPEITKAIVQGRQPVEFTAIKLMRAGQFPLLWPDQRRELGFDYHAGDMPLPSPAAKPLQRVAISG